MRLSPEALEFIHAPDTIDFVTRASDAFFEFARTSTDVVVGQMLSGRYVLGYMKAEKFHLLEEALGTAFISSVSVVLGLLDRPALDTAGVSQVHSQPYLNLKGRGVLLGFVDTGIDYTQDVFRYADGTSKIQYIYDQTADGDPPAGFVLGREYSKADLDAALASDDPYALVPQRDEDGHGTFLASVAAGRQTEDFSGAAPDAEIIAVKLKTARPFYRERYCVPRDQQHAYESSAVMVGVEYILRKARELGRPVAICIGLGTNAGGHDGYSVFEEYLGGVSIQKGVCLCAAAGNEAEARHHTGGVLRPGEPPGQVDLKVGENAGDVYIAVWNTVADRLSASVRSPSGELVGRVPARPGVSPAADVKLVLEAARVQVEYHFPVEGSGGQLTVIRILGATPGVWTIQLHGDVLLNGGYQVWLPMSGFVSPTVEFLAATPDCTVTSPASAVGIICCGAYDSASKSLYAKSSRGPAWDGRVLPDLTAPGVGVGGIYPYGPGSMSGTSAAAAVLAGVCALLLQWGVREGNDPAMGTYQIRAYLIRGCLRRPDMVYPNNQWGYGSVQLMQTFHLMREL
ncbi:MAG: S8 family peptidase [Oscillospiraceae bacterium]|nr:S8 family peptidase [Oscillospiraceae bacterium]